MDAVAKETGIEHGVVVALLDHLRSQFICEEVEPEEYVGTALAERMSDPSTENAFTLLFVQK